MTADRLKKFIDFKGISVYAFENTIGCSRGLISKATKEHNNIGSHIIENILRLFPEINPDWLTTGQGEMIRNSKIGHNQNGSINTIKDCPFHVETSAEKEVALLKEEIVHLKERLRDKEEIISLLKQKLDTKKQ